MTGVEVLAMEEVVIDTVFNWTAFAIALGVILCIFLIMGFAISFSSRDWDNLVIGAIVGTIFGSVLGIGFGFGLGIPTEYETQYKVIITDEVSMSDFLSKYELIEQDGRIYTVVERE